MENCPGKLITSTISSHCWVRGMAQWIQVLAAQTRGLGSVPEAHKEAGDNQSYRIPLRTLEQKDDPGVGLAFPASGKTVVIV